MRTDRIGTPPTRTGDVFVCATVLAADLDRQRRGAVRRRPGVAEAFVSGGDGLLAERRRSASHQSARRRSQERRPDADWPGVLDDRARAARARLRRPDQDSRRHRHEGCPRGHRRRPSITSRTAISRSIRRSFPRNSKGKTSAIGSAWVWTWTPCHARRSPSGARRVRSGTARGASRGNTWRRQTPRSKRPTYSAFAQ